MNTNYNQLVFKNDRNRKISLISFEKTQIITYYILNDTSHIPQATLNSLVVRIHPVKRFYSQYLNMSHFSNLKYLLI